MPAHGPEEWWATGVEDGKWIGRGQWPIGARCFPVWANFPENAIIYWPNVYIQGWEQQKKKVSENGFR